MENLLAKTVGDPQKMLALFKVMESIQLLMEIFPKAEIRPLKIGTKEYIAILFERPQKAKENV